MLEARDISFGYEKPILDNVSLFGKGGDIISIMGVSGSGKSTLLHILSSFLKPTLGTIKLFNKDIYSLSQSEILNIRRKDLGIIFQSHYLFLGFSAYENLQIAEILSNEKIDSNLLELFGIQNIINHNVSTLSGGQQQRLSIARILTKKPKIIFADEPTGNLDREMAFNVMEILFSYAKANSSLLIFVTHDPLLAKRADMAYELRDSKLHTLSI
ncbi:MULTISPECIES: ABC transporter ATP-binding protein [Helicobacter]|uniref:ABC transporter ATP-binding protein n=1 Tax=Helicobacter ibis TaxID=2962633 RepID=A0ABT4VG08_9HELI|nr:MULTISPECIES: ABC transporter ATP-binding protein [Helicobacter]MDA3967976.1 ABC transporter ATP-binding protein [Helicobacter sp. WB40]MDA3969644.1 ABC transporter ATP-binding protein [Helicobacter ibis]